MKRLDSRRQKHACNLPCQFPEFSTGQAARSHSWPPLWLLMRLSPFRLVRNRSPRRSAAALYGGSAARAAVVALPAVAAVSHRRHSWGMPTRRPAMTTPDLFSALPTVTAVPKGKAGPDGLASQQRRFLPNDLAGALKRLDDVEIDALLAAVTTEAERRGRRPPSSAKEKPVSDAKLQRRQEPAEDGAGSLTTGKLNAVRAAFKAGVKPSAIARQFGISQSDVRKALSRGTRRED